jgi:hypothetical protein
MNRFVRGVRYAIFLIAAVGGFADQTAAQIIGFDSEPPGPISTVIEGDFTISVFDAFISSGAGSCTPECAENGTPYLVTPVRGLTSGIQIERTDGQPFTPVSIDLAEYRVGDPATDVAIESGNPAQLIVVLDGVNDGSGPATDFETVALGPEFANTTYLFLLTTGDAGYSVDNIVIANDVPALRPWAAASLAALLAATAALAVLRRLTLRSSLL